MIRLGKTTGVTAAAAVALIAVLTNTSPTVAHAMENIPVIGAIAQVFTFRTFEDSKNNYEAKVEVPQVKVPEQSAAAANQSIEE